MNAQELIKALQQLPPDKRVFGFYLYFDDKIKEKVACFQIMHVCQDGRLELDPNEFVHKEECHKALEEDIEDKQGFLG